jgi:hypothetical protein
MSVARSNPPESGEIVGISPGAGRPLFVPPGIARVRTGPTTHAELDRLLEDVVPLEPLSEDMSGIRLRQVASPSLWLRLLTVLGFAGLRAR